MWLQFQNDGGAEFEFFLAETLGMSVAAVRELSHEEVLGWSVYFGRKAQRKQLAAKGGAGP